MIELALLATAADVATLWLGLAIPTFAEANPAARVLIEAGGIELAVVARMAFLAFAFSIAELVGRPGRWGAYRPRLATAIIGLAVIAGAIGATSNVLALIL